MSEQADRREKMLWFTEALKIPTFIGKPPGGGHFPGGPYSLTQAVGAIGFFLAGQVTMGIWGQWSGLMNNLLLGGSTVVVLFALKLVKPTRRNPVSAATAIGSHVVPPLGGKFRDKPIRRRPPHRVRHGRINAFVALPPVKSTTGTSAAPDRDTLPTVDLRKTTPAYAFEPAPSAPASTQHPAL